MRTQFTEMRLYIAG